MVHHMPLPVPYPLRTTSALYTLTQSFLNPGHCVLNKQTLVRPRYKAAVFKLRLSFLLWQMGGSLARAMALQHSCVLSRDGDAF